jgi:hypothetical protein
MLWMEKRCSSSGAASLSTLFSRTSGSSSVAACSKIGAIVRQGTAPVRPEINQQRDVAVICVLVKVSCSLQPTAFVKRPMTRATLAALAHSLTRHAVDRFATRTDNVQRAGNVRSKKDRMLQRDELPHAWP